MAFTAINAYIPLRCKSNGLYRCHIWKMWQFSGAYLLGGYALLNLNIIKKNEHNKKERNNYDSGRIKGTV